MPRPLALDEAAMEVQVATRELRLRTADPLWRAAIASCDWRTLSDAHALDDLFRAAERLARGMAGLSRSTCADGLLTPGHGRAA